jgi:hypothetical protein
MMCRSVMMRRSLVPMRRMTLGVVFRGKLLAHQRTAIALAHDLLVGHAVARANGPLRQARFGGLRVFRPM